MLLLIFFAFLSFNEVLAQNVSEEVIEGELTWRQKSGLLKTPAPEGDVDDDNFKNYLFDKCEEVHPNVLNENLLREKGMRRCQDLTVSFIQPKAGGIGGYEGRCGQTAASNIFYGLCSLIKSPRSMIRWFADATPGARPDTLMRGMNSLFWKQNERCPQEGEWRWYYHRSASSFVDSMKKAVKGLEGSRKMPRKTSLGKIVERSPVALLIRTPGSHSLHWITLIDVETTSEECVAVVNHWDNQYRTPCATLAKWSKGVASSYPLVFNPYNMVVFTR